MHSIFRLVLSTAFVVQVSLAPGLAREPIPPIPPNAGGAQSSGLKEGTVTAVVVKSWYHPSGLVWQHLNDHWDLFGTTPISIDYTTLAQSAFTLTDLQNVGADVVIVSNSAGGFQQWSADEVMSLQTYALDGHNLVGTFAVFQHSNIDNRSLAPLWGLNPALDYNPGEFPEPAMSLLEQSHCLFTGISDPMQAVGFPFTQVPLNDLSWDAEDLAGAVLVGRSPSGPNAVTAYDAGPYDAHYIACMPEFQDGEFAEATRWLYNAITCKSGTIAVEDMSWGGVKVKYRE